MNEEGNKNVSGENEEQNGRKKVGWFWAGMEEVMDTWESCSLWWEKIKDACWWRLSGNCLQSWIRIVLQVMLLSVFQYQLKCKLWVGFFSFLMKMIGYLVLKELYCSEILCCWRGCWIITASEFRVAAASVSNLCHTAFPVATEQRGYGRGFSSY